MDPLTLTALTAAGTVLVGPRVVAAALRPLAPSPATIRRAGQLTATGTLAGAVALTGTAPATAGQLPPDIPASVPSAAPGPDNQAPLPDGRPWMAAVTPWNTTDQHATRLPAPEATPKRPARTARPAAGPKRPARGMRSGRGARAHRVTVQRGDTLWSLAKTHGTTWRALVAANRAAHPSLAARPGHLRPGWVLRIPGGAR